MKKRLYSHKGKIFNLDQEEQEIMDSYEVGDLIPVDNQAMETAAAIAAAKNTPPRQTISMRVNYQDLLEFKAIANEERIPYQTLLGSLIHKYNTGQLVIKDKGEKKYSAKKASK